MVSEVSTREAYGEALLRLGRERTDIVVLDADLAKSTRTILFGKEFPERFFYVGAAEQNMMGMAAGLAASGKTVFASTFAVFASGRAFDQVRLLISQPAQNVKIVASHAGITVGEDGMSAQAVEDLAIMSSLANFTIVVPADAREAELAVRAAADFFGPFYIRVNRSPSPSVSNLESPFQIGKAVELRYGSDVTIIACGIMVAMALEAAALLESEGISARVLNMHTLQPLDEDAIVHAAVETGAIVTAEEHLERGGLGAAVAQVVGRTNPVPIRFVALHGYGRSGNHKELLEYYGLTPESIHAKVRDVLSKKAGLPGSQV